MNNNRELNGNRNCSKPFKGSSPSNKKVVTIVTPKEELIPETPNERNWRGICIALLVITAVLALILFFIVLLSPPYEGPFNPGIKFTIDQITSGEFKSASFNGTWISDTAFIFRDYNGGVSIFNANNNSVRILMNNSTFRLFNGIDFLVSSDLKYVLLTRDVKKIHKYVKKMKYRVQDIYSPNFALLSPFPHKNEHNSETPYIDEVLWSPVNNALLFVHKNNIFYKSEALSNSVFQVTYSGSEFVYNGVPDWLYQKEITHGEKCMWISPDGKYLVFATFNDTSVGEFKYPLFKSDYQYPQIVSLNYPKVGTANPRVTLTVVNLQDIRNESFVVVKEPEIFSKSDFYLINVIWSDSNRFAVVWINRQQTIKITSICSKPSWHCEDIPIANVTGDKGWVDFSRDLIFSSSGDGFVTIASVFDNGAKYAQLCYVDISTKIVTAVTYGMVVTKIRTWDRTNNVIYFEAAPENKPSQRHLYNVSDNLNATNKWHCLTCPEFNAFANNTNATAPFNISSLISSKKNAEKNRSRNWPIKSDDCLFVRTHFHSFNSPIKYYILECLGPDVPKIFVMNATAANIPSYVLNNQSELAAKYARMARPQMKILQIELESGYQAQVKLLLPPVLREHVEVAFPFILYVGTSPGDQGVTYEWSVDWNTYLVSGLNFVVAIIDARGSNCQSDEMKYEIQKKIGTVDVEDQLYVFLQLVENLEFVDKSRTGVWGKGYGGYVTGRLLEQNNGTFQCGVAVAPITSWAHYVSIWTERFMATPNVTDNYRGYEEADLTKKASKFKDKKLLLVHGTADKMVHFQHTMLLIHALSKQGVLFRHLTYPDEGHDFSTSANHVIKTMEVFWNECFGPSEYEDYDEGLSFLSFAQ